MIYIVFLILFICVVLSLMFKLKNFLILLLNLEILVLLIFFLIFYLFRLINDRYLILIYLVIRVCERVLGLSILILIVRIKGSDYLILFNIN